jgi:diguanylate cyclase (GGDEF)-like protein
MKKILNRQNLINIIVITIISLFLTRLSTNYPLVTDIDYDDVIFSLLLVFQYIIWMIICSMVFGNNTTYHFVRTGLVILQAAAFADLLDEFYDVEGLVSLTETLGEILGMFIITIGLIIYYKKNKEKIHHITALKNKYYQESIRDNMTGLYNQTYYYNYYKEISKDINFISESNYLLVMDLDNFKNINDIHGHNTGDQIIRILGNAILSSVQNTQHTPFRYGGDEFIILFRAITVAEIKDIVENIKNNTSKVLQSTDLNNGEYLEARFSIGITEQKNDDTGESLFKRGDKLMYAAKERGRNSIVTD